MLNVATGFAVFAEFFACQSRVVGGCGCGKGDFVVTVSEALLKLIHNMILENGQGI
jgi:hypothetical protein